MIWFFLILTACDQSESVLQSKDEQIKIAVIGAGDFFPDRTGAKRVQGLPDDLAARVMERLSSSKRFNVLERTALRNVINEQQFGVGDKESFLDRALNAAVDNLSEMNADTVAVTGILSDHNDLVKDYQNLGTAIGADYLVFATLEKARNKVKVTAVPYSDSGATVHTNEIDARLRLRVIKTKTGEIAGAANFKTKLKETVFAGKESTQDEFSVYDHLAFLAANKVLDVAFPAKIVSKDPLVINRGSNDGVEEGKTYKVVRAGKEIHDQTGISIGRVNSDVGEVKITGLQKTLSVVEVLSGTIEVGDLLLSTDGDDAMSPNVQAQAIIPLNKQQGQSTLPRLAVGFVNVGSTASTSETANQHIPVFTDTLISKLVQTKHFQLIDRQEVDQLLNEQLAQSLTENRDMSSALGALKGADYLVYGNLANFKIGEQSLKLPGSDTVFVKSVAHIDGNMRIVDARSGDIIESRKISVERKGAQGLGRVKMSQNLADAYAEQVVINLMNALYPIKVATIEGTTAYINRGSDGGLQVGDILNAVRPGQAVIDPDTGVQLGQTETDLGEVTLTEVEDARSKARIGQVQLQTGDILKLIVADQESHSSGLEHSGGQVGERKGKLSIAVGAVKFNRRGKHQMLADGQSLRVKNDMMVKLTNANRFDVVERQEIDQILEEKAFTSIVSGKDIDAGVYELVGADYLVMPFVDDFYIMEERTPVAYVEKIQIRHVGIVDATLRMVDAHTGKLVAADRIRINKAMKKSANTGVQTSYEDLLDEFTDLMTANIIERLYPIKVIGVLSVEQAYINRGSDGGLSAGQIFNVMRPGEEMIDPDTGISIGTLETKVAQVKITSVESARSSVQVLSGDAIQRGDVLRIAELQNKAAAKVQVNRPNF